jgi:multicomponent K+:H+ antiporter subunit E
MMMSSLQRLFPHPLLSITTGAVWVLLVNDVSMGNLVLATILGCAIPLYTSIYWPDRPRIRHPRAVLAYLGVVLWDIVVSNIQVAYLILFRRGETLRSQFVTVPLDLTTAEAITTLAGTITLTPGTVSADLSADGRALLVHCLETADPDATVAQIKARYERPLKEIFES